ncbi:MAG: DUF1036 domain-containing protein [Acidobacteriota bacterium]|nr:DUF1036 domain-containing protein [Acidobacteriota bacterium]MDH3530659.1 DUF1036 domain-containing protein [Acidobacteriota bacterium]
MHKPKTVTLFAIGCVELNSGESIFWNRKGVFTPFKVKVYEVRKVIDKYLYARDLPADTGSILIGVGGRFGFSRFKNIRPKYTLKACNTRFPGGIYLVIGLETNFGFWTEGWWKIDEKKCIDIPISKRLKEKHNIPYGTIPRTYYYARTYYGDESLYWRGGEGDSELCINAKKRFSKLQFKQDGTGVKTPLPCTADDHKLVKFRRANDPTATQEVIRLDF